VEGVIIEASVWEESGNIIFLYIPDYLFFITAGSES
jgi:hypothetical protein